MDQNRLNNKNDKGRLILSMHLIDVFIGAIIALICVLAYISIPNIYVRVAIIVFCVITGIISFIIIYKKLNKPNIIINESNIRRIELVNEDNEIIKIWDVSGQVSIIIGKTTRDNPVFMDLSKSIYSPQIDNNHAVLNYAGGKWYLEDLSEDKGVVIQKVEDEQKYRLVKGSPCFIKRGDIIFISKVKLLLN